MVQTENFIDIEPNLRVVTDDDRDPSRDLWEEYADWWIENFTGGADAEYEEQILPLAVEHAGGTGDANQIRHQLRGDRRPGGDLPVLTGVAVVRNDRVD